MTDSDTQWRPVRGFSRYEASDDDSGVRVIRTGRILTARPHNRGYVQIDMVNDSGEKKTVTMQTAILLAHVSERPSGMEACHKDGNKRNNRRVNLSWGTKEKNNGPDKTETGTQTKPIHPCLNHERCGGFAYNPGKRCRACVQEVGVYAGAELARKQNLETVAERLGYSDSTWVYKLAAEFGGYTGTLREARAQHPPWSQRVSDRAAVTLRHQLRRASAATIRNHLAKVGTRQALSPPAAAPSDRPEV